jgi:hypothetical protein
VSARAVRAGPWAALAALSLCACDAVKAVPQPQGPAPDAAAVAAAQKARLAAIPTLAMRGVAELGWTDDAGTHAEDGDFELVLRAPMDTSLRVTKFGERVMWAGSGNGQWWLFEPKAQPSRVTVGAVDEAADGEGLLGLMRPGQLLATLGLQPIEESDVRQVEWDARAGCWRTLVDFNGVPMAIELRHASLLPISVEWMDAQGRVRMRSELSAFAWPGAEESVTRPGALVATRVSVSVFDPPAEATLIREGRAPSPRATLALSAGTPTDGSARIRDRLFDFESLRAALKPEVTQRAGTGEGAAP